MIVRILTAPEAYTNTTSIRDFRIFLAGGITNCEDWQSEAIERFQGGDFAKELERRWNRNIVLMNPRRPDFDIQDISQSDIQLQWEREMLEQADLVMFWFAKGLTIPQPVQPISLYELGKYTARKKDRLIIGSHPEYSRVYDVTYQSKLEGLTVLDSLSDVVTVTLLYTSQRFRKS